MVLKVQDKNKLEKGVEHVGASSCLKYKKMVEDGKGVKKAVILLLIHTCKSIA